MRMMEWLLVTTSHDGSCRLVMRHYEKEAESSEIQQQDLDLFRYWLYCRRHSFFDLIRRLNSSLRGRVGDVASSDAACRYPTINRACVM
jgi:hypothetical protein